MRVCDEPDHLYEVSLYASFDPVLKDLFKQYKDANKQALFLNNEFPEGDPMLEVADDRKESLWSAVETRLLELREEEKFSDMASLCLLRRKEERAGLVVSRQKEEEIIARKKIDRHTKEKNRKNRDADILMFFLWLWLSKEWAEKSLKTRRNLQGCFVQAA